MIFMANLCRVAILYYNLVPDHTLLTVVLHTLNSLIPRPSSSQQHRKVSLGMRLTCTKLPLVLKTWHLPFAGIKFGNGMVAL